MLGVTKSTLYAYVSRGKLTASPGTKPATRSYHRGEVERLAAGRARGVRQVARATLDWGVPVLESKLTLIADQRLYYRGMDAVALSDEANLEDVACLLWQAAPVDAFGGVPPGMPASWGRDWAAWRSMPLPDRVLAAFSLLQAHRPASRTQADARFSAKEAGALLRLSCAAALGHAAAAVPVHEQFAAGWRLRPQGADAVRAALVLSADHELNTSGFVARCIASTGAGLGQSVVGGLAALSGGRHGGMTARVEAMWDELARAKTLRAGVERLLARGDPICGFGHPLYPDGDPRAEAILARLPAGEVRKQARRLARQAEASTGHRPSLDFALVALRRALGAPADGAYALFSVGRTVGWLAHALEQRTTGELIRPRAAYTGVLPAGEVHLAPARGPVSVFVR
ncbi:citrate synthase family protein [soil metagenome]